MAHFSHWLPASNGLALLPALLLSCVCCPQPTLNELSSVLIHLDTDTRLFGGSLLLVGETVRTIWQSTQAMEKWILYSTLPKNSSTKHPQGLQQTHICAVGLPTFSKETKQYSKSVEPCTSYQLKAVPCFNSRLCYIPFNDILFLWIWCSGWWD